MKIRKSTLEDIPTIVEMWQEFMKEHDEIVITANPENAQYLDYKETAPEQYKTYITGLIESDESDLLLAEENGTITGYVLLYIKNEIPIFKVEKLGYIGDFYVKPEFRGRGIATKLKEAAFDRFREKGLEHASLLMYPDNKKAHDIYKNWGFFDYKIDMRKLIVEENPDD